MDKELEAAINTYMFFVLGMKIDEIACGGRDVGFFIDPEKQYIRDGVTDEMVTDIYAALMSSLIVLEENEHYEKCQDIKEWLKMVGYEV